MKTYWCMGWFGLLFIVAALACTTTAPALDLIKRDDHRGLAVWYDHEAARLQGNAEEMLQMAAEYAKSSYHHHVLRALSKIGGFLHTPGFQPCVVVLGNKVLRRMGNAYARHDSHHHQNRDETSQ